MRRRPTVFCLASCSTLVRKAKCVTVRILKPGAFVVTTKAEFAARGGMLGDAVFIGNFDTEQLGPESRDSNVTYDLRVGYEYRFLVEGGKHHLDERESFRLKGGESALIQTEEFVTLPANVFGLVVAKVGLAQQGMSNISTKIDPGYDGHLIITVSNLARRPITFTRGDPFCSVLFLGVEGDAMLYEKAAKTIGTGTSVSKIVRLSDKFQANPALVAVVAAVLGSVATAVVGALID